MNTVADLLREARFMLRQSTVPGLFIVVFSLTTTSLALGIAEVRDQEATIALLLEADREDREAALAPAEDYGTAAYNAFYLTYDRPTDLAFASLGQRDVAPWLLRIRALALEGQIYESDSANPELSLFGRLDFTFLISFLLPLFVIALLHDLAAGEREAGRDAPLLATAGKSTRLWIPRTATRVFGLLGCLLIPFLIAALWEGSSPAKVAGVMLVVIAQTAIWVAITLALAFRRWSSPAIAAGLLAVWLVLTLIVPMTGKLAIERAVPGVDGADIALQQREAVNDAWDLPKAVTMHRFYTSHPQWADTGPVTVPFHWKWYYAFQQVGDESVAELSSAYRDAIRRRDRMTGRVAFLSPAVAVQRAMQRLAGTDTLASLAYEGRIRSYHEDLRKFWYPPIFGEVPFDPQYLQAAPVFGHREE